MITGYLHTFANFKDWELMQSWRGIYPKMMNGQTELILKPESGVAIINGIGGNGMTFSFGLCEDYIGGR